MKVINEKNTRQKDKIAKKTQEKSVKKDSYRCKRHKVKIQNRNMFLLSLKTNYLL